MSIVIKGVAILVIVLSLQLTESNARKYITHKSSRLTYGGKDHEKLDTVIIGKITCHGKGKEGIRPYLESPEYPHVVMRIETTDDSGWFLLTTTTTYKLRTHIYLTIRHQCEIDELGPQEGCAIPYYATRVRLDVLNTTYIHRDVELSKMKDFSSSDCL